MFISRFMAPVALLCLLVITAASCGESTEPQTPMESTADQGEVRPGFEKTIEPSEELLTFVYYQDVADDYTYEVALSGTVSVADGGLITGHPASWPLIYRFSYFVKPGSINPASLEDSTATSIEISILVPVRNTNFLPGYDEVMPMILEPDGLEYFIPENASTPAEFLTFAAELTLSLHPDLPPSCESYAVFSADWDDQNGYFSREIIVVQEPADLTEPNDLIKAYRDPIEPIDPIDADLLWECWINIPADILHHSRWAVTKNDGDEDGPMPN